MDTTKRFLILTGLAILSLAACKRVDNSPQTRYGSLSETRVLLERAPNVQTVDGGNGGSYIFGRCRVIVPANAFQTWSGGAVTGSIELQIRDVLRRGEMIFTRVLPVSNGDPLVSGGEVQIHAQQNGNPLRLRPGVALEIRIPQGGQDPAGMQLFLGQHIENINNDGANLINWQQRRNAPQGGIIINGDTINLITDTVGWCNADRFLQNPNYQTFTVSVNGPTGFQQGEILGYAPYDNFLGVWPLTNRSGNVYSETHVPDVPVHFVVYGVKDGQFYGGIAAATPANGGNYTVTLSATTPQEFKVLVDAL